MNLGLPEEQPVFITAEQSLQPYSMRACVCVWGRGIPDTVCMWKSLLNVGSRDHIQVVSLGDKHFYPWSHFTSPQKHFNVLEIDPCRVWGDGSVGKVSAVQGWG